MKAVITIAATLILLYILLIIFTKIQLRQIRKRVKVSNVSGTDMLKDKEKLYYREVLNGYSPAELSYVDNFKIEGKREVIATLLSLKLKNVIDIVDNRILIKNYNIEDLSPTEEFVFKNIKEKRVEIKYDALKKQILKEVSNDGLIEDHPLFVEAKMVCEKIIIYVIVLVFYVFGFLFLKLTNKDIDENFSLLSFAIVLILIVFYRESKNIMAKRMPRYETFVRKLARCDFLKRTPKAEDVNMKIEGLKKYIKDYSLLNEKNKDALDVWEEYLIYSVLFDEESKAILKDMSKLVKIK